MNDIRTSVIADKSINGSNKRFDNDNPSSPVQADTVSLTGNGGNGEPDTKSLREFVKKHPGMASKISGITGLLTGYSLEKHDKAKKLEKDISTFEKQKHSLIEEKNRLEVEKSLESFLNNQRVKPPSQGSIDLCACGGAIVGAGAAAAVGASIPLMAIFLVAGSLSAVSSAYFLHKLSNR
ncbi:MAG: hypothetical protein K8T10_09155 [Candidatus Eremiobacteraeota bacterium]|nr:hypothetical protein [Candidatus Eremiobacteraeota bacterium]